MNEVKIFENAEFGSIRTTMIDNEPWFVGKDVAEALGYSNSRDALNKHVDSEDKNTVAIRDGTQGNPNITVINESGVYSLVFGSKLEGAKRFKRWVTSEVLPAIRKTGGYIAGEENMSDDELLSQALLVAQRKLDERTRQLDAANAQLDEGYFRGCGIHGENVDTGRRPCEAAPAERRGDRAETAFRLDAEQRLSDEVWRKLQYAHAEIYGARTV